MDQWDNNLKWIKITGWKVKIKDRNCNEWKCRTD